MILSYPLIASREQICRRLLRSTCRVTEDTLDLSAPVAKTWIAGGWIGESSIGSVPRTPAADVPRKNYRDKRLDVEMTSTNASKAAVSRNDRSYR